MNTTSPTIKAKNVRVANPHYSPRVARWAFAVAAVAELLAMLDLI